MGFVRIKKGDIRVGRALPWPVYKEDGMLLLKKGTVLAKQHQIDSLVDRGFYPEGNVQRSTQTASEKIANPFPLAYEVKEHLNTILHQLNYDIKDAEYRLSVAAKQLSRLCAQHPDAMLGLVHHYHDAPYSITHSFHVSILCTLLGRAMEFDEYRMHTLVGAALTSNIAMLHLQDRLEKFQGELNAEQKAEIRQHPEVAVELLIKAGIKDELWHHAVAQHHESMDGSGYPHGAKGEAICIDARIIAVADRYSAMVTKRKFHPGKTAQEVLKDFFVHKGEALDEQVCVQLIKLLGVFPPGTVVKLANGETAMVTERSKNEKTHWPMANSFVGPAGDTYLHPLLRDTNKPEYGIRQMIIEPEEIPFNNSMLWGYKEP